MIKISSSEKKYMLQGIEQNCRADGRKRLDSRDIVLEMGVLPQSNGSARLSLANGMTDILVSVKAEIFQPTSNDVDSGDMKISVSCCPSVCAKFGGRLAIEVNTELTQLLNRLLCQSNAFNMKSLCIIPGQSVWNLYIDVMVFDTAGNLPDMMSIAVFAALNDTLLPHIDLIGVEGEEKSIQVESDTAKGHLLEASNMPILITLSCVGGIDETNARQGLWTLVDATLEEELCAIGQLTIALNQKGEFCGMQKSQSGGLDVRMIQEMIEQSRQVSPPIFNEIHKVFKEQRKRDTVHEDTPLGLRCVGFLG